MISVKFKQNALVVAPYSTLKVKKGKTLRATLQSALKDKAKAPQRLIKRTLKANHA